MHLRGTIKFHSRLGSNIIMQQKSDVCLSEIFDQTVVETEQEDDDVDTKNAATTNNNMLMRMRSFDRKLKKRPPLCKTSSLNSHVLLDIPELIGMNSDPSLPVDEEGHADTFAISLEFKDVSYKLTLNGSDKRIVHGVTGSVRPGQVLALMGPSGSGKTTLLNLLSGRLQHNTGTITYNRQTYTKSLKQNIGFVLQNDLVFPHLTVKETLTYSALLRLPNSLSTEEKKDRAKLIISELGLERCQDSMIGGVSGGERKRACIGIEILLDPSLLFLDEPTSGLDSTNAARIVGMLRRMARDGRKAVVATIHQPSSRLFREFDELILLGNVGRSFYFGKASEAMVYFSEIGWAPLVAMTQAEFLIDLANGNVKDKSVPLELEDGNGGPSPVDVCEFLLGAYELRASSIDKTPVSLKQSRPERQSKRSTKEYGATWTTQFSILVERGLKERRHEYLSSLRIIQVVSTAIIVGLLWWDSDTKRVQDQAGLLFFVSVFWAFFPVFTAVFTFPQERAMLVKERSVNMYKLSAYLVARNTSDLPLDLLLPVVFLFIVYFMVGLKLSFSAFSLTLMSMFLSIIAAQGLGLCIGAAFMDVKKATTFASVTVMTFMLSGGFLIKRVPPFISWIRYASLNYHTYRLLLKIQYDCESRFIKSEKLDDDGGITEVGAMLVMVIGYRLMTYVLLRRMKLRADA